MSKRQTYEQKLYANMMTLELNQWYNISAHADYNKMLPVIKQFIDAKYPFVFSDDYKKVKRENWWFDTGQQCIKIDKIREMVANDPNYRVEVIEPGTRETFSVFIQKTKITQAFTHTFEKTCYRIWKGDLLVAVE